MPLRYLLLVYEPSVMQCILEEELNLSEPVSGPGLLLFEVREIVMVLILKLWP